MKIRSADISIKQRLYAIFFLVFLVIALVGALGRVGMRDTRQGLEQVVDGHLLPYTHVQAVADAYAGAIIGAANKANQGLMDAADARQSILAARQVVKERWAAYLDAPRSPRDRAMSDQAIPLFARADAETERVLDILAGQAGNVAGQLQARVGPLYLAVEPLSAHLHDLLALHRAIVRAEYDLASANYQRTSLWIWGVGGLGLALSLLFARLLLGSIVRPLRSLATAIDGIVGGKINVDVDVRRRDEIGAVAGSFRRLRDKLEVDVAEARRGADESLRVRIALDNVTTGVMMADNERRIIYANKAVTAMFSRAQEDLRKRFPNFDADRLVGANIDEFHANPAHQAELLGQLEQTHRSEFTLAGHRLTVEANPVIDASGKRLGSVVQWQDRTREVAVQRDIANLVEAAAAGDFSRRIVVTDQDGFLPQLAEGINRLVETSERGLHDIAHMLRALAEGDLVQRIEGESQGLFGQLRDDANRTTERLREIVTQIHDATDAINTAAQEIASGNMDLSHRTEAQAISLEETTSSMDKLTATVRQNANNALQANQLAQGASAVAVKGGTVVGEVVQTMGAIAASSKRIADIIGVIDGIAFQTNILALNAAVEAARAGEQGRGFAVVAGEVRSLAQRSAAAAKEIKTLIDDSAAKVADGYRQVEQAGATMNEIVGAVGRVTAIMGEISHASTEQSVGIEQVNSTIVKMDDSTQQNAALVEQAAAAAATLQDQAASLARTVAVFHLEQTRRPRPAVLRAPPARPALPPPVAAGAPDFDVIISAHQAWKQKLRSALSGGEELSLNPDDIAQDCLCELGRWLYGDGKAYGHLKEYEPLRQTHAEFHLCAADILRKAQGGERDSANSLLVGDFFDLSNRTVQYIMTMKRQQSR